MQTHIFPAHSAPAQTISAPGSLAAAQRSRKRVGSVARGLHPGSKSRSAGHGVQVCVYFCQPSLPRTATGACLMLDPKILEAGRVPWPPVA
mmetsp:Transcript_123272/g.218405  ORF Transcript_123272/g.218405 Transcript_123272/m.218405 type:complete len:91 (+) Transcript_123272:807-1079(+)